MACSTSATGRTGWPCARRRALVGAALVADEDARLDALLLEPAMRAPPLDRRRVVRAAQAAVTGDHNEADLVGRRARGAGCQGLRLQAREEAAEDALERLENARAQHRLLRAAHLRGRNQLMADVIFLAPDRRRVTRASRDLAHDRRRSSAEGDRRRRHHRRAWKAAVPWSARSEANGVQHRRDGGDDEVLVIQ